MCTLNLKIQLELKGRCAYVYVGSPLKSLHMNLVSKGILHYYINSFDMLTFSLNYMKQTAVK